LGRLSAGSLVYATGAAGFCALLGGDIYTAYTFIAVPS
jgi:hypothetical protein